MRDTAITATPPAHLTEEQYEKWIYMQMIGMYHPAGKIDLTLHSIAKETQEEKPKRRKKKIKNLVGSAASLIGGLILPALGSVRGGVIGTPLLSTSDATQREACAESTEEDEKRMQDEELCRILDLDKLKQYAFESYTANEIYSFTRMLSALSRQQKLYPEVLMKTIDELEAHAHELRRKEQAAKSRPKDKPAEPSQPKKKAKPVDREYATFCILKELPLIRFIRLYQFLTGIGWLDAQSDHKDFEALFSGQINRCKNIWGKNEGKGKLRDLFAMMLDKGFIGCPAGYGYLQIVESHFVDGEGTPITGLRGGAHAKGAEQVLIACEKILNGETDNYIRETENLNPDYFASNGLYPEQLHEEDYITAKTSARKK